MRILVVAVALALSAGGCKLAHKAHDKVAVKLGLKKHRDLDDFTVYDGNRDGKQQIAEATARAKREHKRVLLVFGGNWCVWCKALDQVFMKDDAIRAALDRGYVVEHIDTDTNEALDAVYDHPFKLLFPALVLLDEDGKMITKQAGMAFQRTDGVLGFHHDAVLAWLQQNAPSQP